MKDEFGLDRLKTILPTGNTGTLRNYYVADAGFIFAKTGSLTGHLALSGFLITSKNKLLVFSVVVNNHNTSATSVRRAVEKFLQQVRREN
jgi:D-alanyl-D-alanine carboxypeptidase/D-alanyl-D-alanine-endopeptidase (penicillin-binding protein 4)